MSRLVSTIPIKSPFEEIEEQCTAIVRLAFEDYDIDVIPYFEDLDIDALEEFRSRALRKLQVLFDFFSERPITDASRKATNDRVQVDIIQFGFYVGYASVRDDNGYTIRRTAHRAMHLLRSTFANLQLELSVKPGTTVTKKVRFLDIQKEKDIPGVAVYRVSYMIELPLQF